MSDNTDMPNDPQARKFYIEIEYDGDDQELSRLLMEAALYITRNGADRVQVRNRYGHRVGSGRVVPTAMVPPQFLAVLKSDLDEAIQNCKAAETRLYSLLDPSRPTVRRRVE